MSKKNDGLNSSGRWRKQINPNTKRMKALMRDVRANTTRLTKNSKTIDEWTEKLAPYIANNCFSTGIHATEMQDMIQQIVGVIDQTSLPAGANAEIMKGTMAEACYTMVYNVGEDIKTLLREIAVESYNNGLTPYELSKEIGKAIDTFSSTRCEVIARTETARAANLSEYLNAKSNGAKSYSVICNDGACDYCIAEYGDNVFGDDENNTIYDIDDIDNFPPFHPNCRCTPYYMTTPAESEGVDPDATTDETDIQPQNIPSIFAGQPETHIENDSSYGKLTVYTYENGLQLAVSEKSQFTHDEIINHINNLPEIIRTNDSIKKIIITENSKNGISGEYDHVTKVVKVYNCNKSKEEELNTLTHELAHAVDNKHGKRNQDMGLSDPEIYEKIVKEDNKLYTYTSPNGKKRTPNKFPTEYAGKSWLKFKKEYSKKLKIWKSGSQNPELKPRDTRYIEDFAESSMLYLNPKTHDKFVKEFPNRAEYLKGVYGEPNF